MSYVYVSSIYEIFRLNGFSSSKITSKIYLKENIIQKPSVLLTVYVNVLSTVL